MLGGTEVFRHGDFQGDAVQNTLLADQEIPRKELAVNPRTIGVPDLRGGAQRLDVRFVQFDNVVIELLQYRDADQPMGGPNAFAEPLQNMSPAFPRMMHICFHIRDDVDFNKFITDLEARSARRGVTQVRANRIIRVTTEQERKAAPENTNTNKVTVAPSDGWELICCKGTGGRAARIRQGDRSGQAAFCRSGLGAPARDGRRAITRGAPGEEMRTRIVVASLLLAAGDVLASASPAMARESTGIRYGQIPGGAYSIVAEVRAKPGKEAALRAVTLPLVTLVRSDPKPRLLPAGGPRGARAFHLLRGLRQQGRLRSPQRATPYVKAWLAGLSELADGGVKVMRMEVLGHNRRDRPRAWGVVLVRLRFFLPSPLGERSSVDSVVRKRNRWHPRLSRNAPSRWDYAALYRVLRSTSTSSATSSRTSSPAAPASTATAAGSRTCR